MSCDLFRLHGGGGDCAIVVPLKARVAELESQHAADVKALAEADKTVRHWLKQHGDEVELRGEAEVLAAQLEDKLSAANAEIARSNSEINRLACALTVSDNRANELDAEIARLKEALSDSAERFAADGLPCWCAWGMDAPKPGKDVPHGELCMGIRAAFVGAKP